VCVCVCVWVCVWDGDQCVHELGMEWAREREGRGQSNPPVLDELVVVHTEPGVRWVKTHGLSQAITSGGHARQSSCTLPLHEAPPPTHTHTHTCTRKDIRTAHLTVIALCLVVVIQHALKHERVLGPRQARAVVAQDAPVEEVVNGQLHHLVLRVHDSGSVHEALGRNGKGYQGGRDQRERVRVTFVAGVVMASKRGGAKGQTPGKKRQDSGDKSAVWDTQQHDHTVLRGLQCRAGQPTGTCASAHTLSLGYMPWMRRNMPYA
jgi:hypothetical protein